MQLLFRQPLKYLKSYRNFSSNKRLTDELLNNPLFDKAFPDLAEHKVATTIKAEA